MALNLIGYLREGIVNKFTGIESAKSRILVVENPALEFNLGPLLAQVLQIPHCDLRENLGKIPRGRLVLSANEVVDHGYLIDLRGSFGEYLLEGFVGTHDLRIEALKIALQQLVSQKCRF